jgi:SAM-dependent methyltransferase
LHDAAASTLRGAIDPLTFIRSTASGRFRQGEVMDIHDVQFPMAAAAQPGFKGRLKQQIGGLLATLMTQRAARLAQGQVAGDLSLTDRLVIAALVRRHERQGTLDQLNGLHDWLWSSRQALAFHEQAQARFQSWWLDTHSAIVAPLLDEIAAAPGRYRRLCEIGCGSGLVLNDLAQRLPQMEQLIGLDLSAEQIARNRERYASVSRMSFDSGDAAAWLQTNAQPGWIYFSNAGVLEYFPEARLRGLLRQTANRAPAMFAIVEPVDHGHDLEQQLASKNYGAERSWSHNYPHLFRDCGYTLRWQREIEFGGMRWMMLIAVV